MALIRQRRGISTIPLILSISRLLSLPISLARPAGQSFAKSAGWLSSSAMVMMMAADEDKPIEPEDPPDSPAFWWKLGLSVALVLLGGVFAGLTLALMGSDDLNLRVLSTSSDDAKERKAASKVLRLLARGRHWVLVVLLLGNVIVNESLPIFLDDVLGGGLAAVIVSTTMIVIFGEIIPQAVCVRYGLRIGGACAPFVFALMILFFPIAYPIAKLLDYVLGHEEGHTYKKAELKSFLQFHREGEEPLRDDEIGILNGVLSLNEKHVQEIMTPIKDCLTLPSDKVLDHETVDQILLSGFSRIPIHEPGQKYNFTGMLLVKRLITYNPEDQWPVSKFNLLPLPEAKPTINCFQALDYFQTGRAHLLLISETPGGRGGALGIVSLEDLIEEIIGEEIVDETDRYQDNRSRKIAKRAGTGAVMRGIIERHRSTIHALGALSRRTSGVEGQRPVQLGPPTEGGPHDGLLIQFNDGALVAEPVSIPADEQHDSVRVGGKRMVVGHTIMGSPTAKMAEIEEMSVDQNGEGSSEQTQTNDETEDGDDAGENDKKERDDAKSDDERGFGDSVSVSFETHEDFELAAKAFIERYKGHGSADPGPSRTNRGWRWQEHPKKGVRHHGYLCRRMTRYVEMINSSKFTHDNDNEDHDDESPLEGNDDSENEEEDEDPSEHRHLIRKTAGSTRSDRHDPPAVMTNKREKIEIEQHIVYSRTYRVPQLLIRAWDSNGAPLSLTSLIATAILRPNAQIQPLPVGDNEDETRLDVLLLDPHSPFPLIQQTEHPSTGQIAWGIHPCQIASAVDEVLEAEPRSDTRPVSKQEQESRVKWLETWMMITSGVVDLAYA
ncbi:hypothetical protein BD324DRAFT_621300 [Kockovaella imperatae]|uniref:CNNM transmembrane domain-containing protein n=1 Tax=Kockovaella imperatae TaxID=4999 RepID=A0A1Y1UN37_9TREE|nr:hypothetical protein BD324DRAFT_621300 [Kockovaella imperatae]ORX38545.1 hypothetical protein BD324DRAFT_621300 [Kockovaella imperatae]